MSDKKFRRVRGIVGLGLILLFLGLGAWIILNRQYVIDQFTVWNFQPSTEVAAIANEIELTDNGTFHFYATQPMIEDAAQFNTSCPQQEVNNPILGCYVSERIYIYDVANESLQGIKQVTAAHEMLHAVWQRMSSGDKADISKLLKNVYDKLADGDLKDRMDYYQRTEPGEFYNELHSIIGTEVKQLNPELEKYYQRYFEDRQKVVDFHANYSKVFDALEVKSNALYKQLTSLDKQIKQKRASYNQQFADLSADIKDFNQRAKNGSFSSNEQFAAERDALLQRTANLEAERTELNNVIEQYNQAYAQYKIVASQIQQLNTSIDSMSDAPAIPGIE